jgi:hypothetical protein
MKLSIIIVNWHSKDWLRKCLLSVRGECTCTEIEIVVVDNASYDGAAEMIKQEFPEVAFIQSEKNLGFAKANNIGAKKSRGNVLLFLNPDTEIVGATLSILQSELQKLPTAGAVGARLLNSDRTVQTSCIQTFPTLLNQVLDADFLRARSPGLSLWGMRPLFSNDLVPSEVEVLSGAGIMVKKDVFEQVGMFSEQYFMYAEDLDLCFKIRKAGYKNYYIPSASIVHHGGGSSQNSRTSFSAVMMRESIWRFLSRTKGRTYGIAYRIAMFASAAVRLVLLGVSTMPKLFCRDLPVRQALQKWAAILKWSIGLQTWARHL